MGTAITLHIHGSGTNSYVPAEYKGVPVNGYNNPPDLFATVAYDEAVRTGNNVTVNISSAYIQGTVNSTLYKYRIAVFAYLTSTDTAVADLPESYVILNKPQGVSRWDSTAYTCSNVSRTITTNSSTVFLQFYVKAWCNNCATEYHGGTHGVLMHIRTVPISVPASGYTIHYRGVNDEPTADVPYQTALPSSMPTAAEGGITNTIREIDGLTYTFSGWHIPQQADGSIPTWGGKIHSDVIIRSVWRISDYTISKNNHLRNHYVARFVGYDATAQVTTREYVTASRTYHFPGGYVGGNAKPVKQTAFTVSDSVHITQVIGSPTRKQMTDVWQPHYIAYPDRSEVSFTNTGELSPDNSGLSQTYTEVANLTVRVVMGSSGFRVVRHHLPFYDENGKLHEMSDYVLDDGSVIQGDWRTATITGNGTITSHWHNPQIWKYRDSGKLYTAENANRGSGWYQDVDLKKFTGGDPTNDSSWKVSNKWKYSEGSWVNCDTDLLINR